MNAFSKNIKITSPKNQLYLFGYKTYFNFFIKLFEKKKLPNSIIFSGAKGLGKSTFIYHFINYLLSRNENSKYSTNDFVINKDNSSYQLLIENIHPNFFLIENHSLEKDIKIDQVRNLLQYLNKSTYSKDLKIIMIDSAERLNLNSSNALLKAIEEPRDNTFFFIIHNSTFKILDTIRSRCSEFKFFFTTLEKKNIFKNIIELYQKEFEINDVEENFYFNSPGDLLTYFLSLNKVNIDIKKNKLQCILYFIEKFKDDKNPDTLLIISLFIEMFYNELCLNNSESVNSYFFNQSKILRLIKDMEKFNLNEKNIFISIKNILLNDAK